MSISMRRMVDRRRDGTVHVQFNQRFNPDVPVRKESHRVVRTEEAILKTGVPGISHSDGNS
jgi:hypothetical protein